MKNILRIIPVLLLVLSAACVQNAAPNGAAAGPEAWIDAPLDFSTLPLAQDEIVAHASDLAGLSAFEVSVNGQVLGTVQVDPGQAGNTIAHVSQTWLPPAPGTYLLEVRAQNANGVYGPPASAQVIVGGTATAVPPAATATITPTPTLEGTWAVGLENANCRVAPDRSAEVQDFLLKDQRARIDGISPDRTYVWIQTPSGGNGHCWVLLSVIQVEGSLTGLRTILPPPTPTPTATSGHS